jgi:hypothetical protein
VRRASSRLVWVDDNEHHDANRLDQNLREAIEVLMDEMQILGIEKVIVQQRYVIEEDYSI